MAYRPSFYNGITGNTSGNTAMGTGSYLLAGGNNVTLSQSTNANGSTISVNGAVGTGFSGTNATATLNSNGMQLSVAAGGGGGVALSAAGQSASTGTITFSNSNGMAFGMGASVITASYTQSGQAFSASGGSSTFSTLSFSNGNGITFTNNAGQVGASYTVPTVTNSSLTMQAGASTLSSVSRVAFSDGNGISFGASTSNNGSITITGTVATNYAASNHSHGNPTLSLSNLSGATASASNGLTLSLSGPAMFDAGVSNTAAGGSTSGNMAISNSGGLAFYAGSNIGLSQATAAGGNASVTIQAAGGGGGGVALSAGGALYSSGTLNLSNAGGALTMSTSPSSVLNLAVPDVSTLAGTNGISISSAGSGITIDGDRAGATLSRWDYPNQVFSSLGSGVVGSLSIQHMYVPFNVTAQSMKMAASINVSTFNLASTASANVSLSMGIYTLSGSTLSSVSSGSANNAITWLRSASSSQASSVTGLRQLTVPMNIDLAPGEYWVAAAYQTATTATAIAPLTIFGDNQIFATGVLGVIGSLTSAGRDVMLGQGIFSTTTNALPASIPLSQINNYSASYAMMAAFYNAMYNATY